MQEEHSFSADYEEEAGRSAPGLFSFLLSPPVATLLFGALLFAGLVKLPFSELTTAPAKVAAVVAAPSQGLASFFAPEVLRWEAEIVEWAGEHGLDANLVATVMQIESCGDPEALSGAGAMGLFQVMPDHFVEGEDSYVPATNALRGLGYLAQSLAHFEGDASLAMAGYNGGINGASRPQVQWEDETIDYQYWGENISEDAQAGRASSAVLNEWMAAGGASLCAQAGRRLATLP
jgi:hypothetical protein